MGSANRNRPTRSISTPSGTGRSRPTKTRPPQCAPTVANRWGEQSRSTGSSGVCLAAITLVFPRQLRGSRHNPMNVIWDNSTTTAPQLPNPRSCKGAANA